MSAVANDPDCQLQLIVTGMHLSPEFGLTWRNIEQDGFHIDRKVEVLLSSDTPVGISKSMGLGMIGIADALAELAPDILVVLGDRYEILSAAIAAMVARIPIAHIHGGEATEGLIDEAIRHAVSKMSHYHFVSTEEYRRRVIQLGEAPERVFTVGGLGLDSLRNIRLLPRDALESELGFKFMTRNLLVTFHPVTLEKNTAAAEFGELLAALESLKDTGLIFTLPNADTDGRQLIRMVEEFVARRPHAKAFPSLGQLNYLSCMQEVDGVVGNSSSGLIEAPSLRKATINIGVRQAGRIKAASVIDCLPQRQAIIDSITRLYSKDFVEILRTVRNPYGEPGASKKIAAMLSKLDLDVLKKRFHDVSQACE
jgi:GDP/UDP-N,N'-diacetylbacillosamine 2-epimerase (hydrolysing)